MGTPHKHRDVIIAWANGEEIEWRTADNRPWVEVETLSPSFNSNFEFRIKPKRVKKEGWVNVYRPKCNPSKKIFTFHATEDEAHGAFYKISNTTNRTACIRIEWEEI